MIKEKDKQGRRGIASRAGRCCPPRLTFTRVWIWNLKLSFHSGFRQLEMVLVLSLLGELVGSQRLTKQSVWLTVRGRQGWEGRVRSQPRSREERVWRQKPASGPLPTHGSDSPETFVPEP